MTGTRRTPARIAWSFWLCTAALSAATACAPSRPPTTSLRLQPATGMPRAAKVVIDDIPVGSLDFVVKRGVAMPPGRHRITIEASGYLPWDAEVDAGPNGGLVQLPVALVRVPD